MHLPLFPRLCLFPLAIFIFTNLPTSTCSGKTQFSNCTQSFNCGKITNLTYPFWGDNRPSYCGRPEFEVHCHYHVPILTLSSQEYRIIETHPEKNMLTIARADFWDDFCPSSLANSSIELTPFELAPATSFLKLLYNCSLNTGLLSEIKTHSFCRKNGTYVTVFFSVGDFNPFKKCKHMISVPILETPSPRQEIGLAFAKQALHQGFEVQWEMDDYNKCRNCTKSGGQCGWDWKNKSFSCYCSGMDDATESESVTRPGKPKSKAPIAIGAVIGSIGILSLLAGLSLFILKRRKQSIQPQSQENKNLGTNPPSPGLSSSNRFHYSRDYTTSPSTNLSQSIPSYPSSKSELDSSSFCYGVQIFSYAELEEATENFNDSRELGDGGFGTVYFGKLQDGRFVAVKRLYDSSFKRIDQFKNEVMILARLRHKYLVALYGCTSRKSRELLLVYEYISNGTVADHLHGKKLTQSSKPLPWSTRLSIAVQTAEALTFLHKSDVIHRDVKTTNILLDNDFQVKVADFGLSRLFPSDVTHVSTAPQGTPGYVDPEYFKCYQVTEKSDVYSFGVVLAELISSKPAVDITRHRHDINLSNMAVDRVRKNALHELVDPSLGYEKDCMLQKMVKLVGEVTFQCLQEEREMRPRMEEVLNSLRGIQKEMTSSMKQVVVDIIQDDDDAGLLKNAPPPFSPEK